MSKARALVEVLEIAQQEIQRLGGICARYPSSCLFCRYLLKPALELLGKQQARILDLTYGEGRFYVACPECIEFLVGIDIQRLPWKFQPDIFIRGPLQKISVIKQAAKYGPFDVLVLDPPFYTGLTRGGERRKWYYRAFGNPRFLIERSYWTAKLLDIPLVISHWKDTKFDTYGYEHERVIKFRTLRKHYYSYFFLSAKNIKVAHSLFS